MNKNYLQEIGNKIIFKAILNNYEVDMSNNIEGQIFILNTEPILLIDLNIEFICIENISILKQGNLNKNILMRSKILNKSKILNCGKHCFPFIICLNDLNLMYPSFDSLVNLSDFESNEISLEEIICSYELNYSFSFNEIHTGTSDSIKKLYANSNITLIQNLNFPHKKFFINEISLCSSLYEILNLFKSKIMRIEIQLNKPFYRTGEEIRIQISNDHFLNEVEIELVKYTIQNIKDSNTNVFRENTLSTKQENFEGTKDERRERKSIVVFKIKDVNRKVIISTLKIPITTQPNILCDSISIIYFLEYKIKVSNSNNVIACRMGLNVFDTKSVSVLDDTENTDYIEVGEENRFPVFYF